MSRKIEDVLLRPGDSVSFADRDDLLEKLDELSRPVPGRLERSKDHREHFCMLRYLRFLTGEGLLPLPVTLRKTAENHDPPDFTLEWPEEDRTETFELTDGSTEKYQRALTEADRRGDKSLIFPEGVDINTPDAEAAKRWAEILFSAFARKARDLSEGRFTLDHLLIYDLTGLGLLIPLEEGVPLLRQKIEGWHDAHQPDHRFRRISVLRDLGLLLDVTGDARLVRGESPRFQLPVIRARDEEDLRRRLRALDRYCRESSIRHLKLFGSVLSDRSDEFFESDEPGLFDPESDLDLLVEFEPGTVVTLLDMARMERELGELIGFKVDLRTAGDLSRYFRQEVLDDAVELHAERA